MTRLKQESTRTAADIMNASGADDQEACDRLTSIKRRLDHNPTMPIPTVERAGSWHQKEAEIDERTGSLRSVESCLCAGSTFVENVVRLGLSARRGGWSTAQKTNFGSKSPAEPTPVR